MAKVHSMSEDAAPCFDFDKPVERKRGVGRGSKFFVLDRALWEFACGAATNNRLNLLTAMLVLLAGTGADHRLTKWSTKACELYAGMGKPRAKLAIEELLKARIISLTPTSSRRFPQYKFVAPNPNKDPIFLPVQLITGFQGENPVLRRVRDTGDEVLLMMLVDLYGRVQVDATHGLPLDVLKEAGSTSETRRKVLERGVHVVWSLGHEQQMTAGRWRSPYVGKNVDAFWDRIELLRNIGALWFEPWVFSSDRDDAEPLFPVGAPESDGATLPLSDRAMLVASLLAADQPYLLTPHTEKSLVVLPAHHSAPAIRGVAKLRVEADTPGRRNAFGARMSATRHWHAEYQKLYEDLKVGRTDIPLRTIAPLMAEQ
jgi:hypothetical protein